MKKLLLFFVLAVLSSIVGWAQATDHENFGTSTGLLGDYSTYVGTYAGKNATSSSDWNTFIGRSTGYSATSYKNTSVGALSSGALTSGAFNTTIGMGAGFYNQTGTGNTFLGFTTGYNTKASYNTFIGYMAGYSNTTGGNNVFIGREAGFNNTTGSNLLYIDNSSTSSPLIYGDFSSNIVKINGKLGSGRTPTHSLEVACSGYGSNAPTIFMSSTSNSTLNSINSSLILFTTSTTSNNWNRVNFNSYDNGGNEVDFAAIAVQHTSRATGAFSGDFIIATTNAGTSTEKLRVKSNGNVGIGTSGPDYKLDVNGTIRCEQLIVVSDVPSSDFVFESNYKLKSLNEVENFIKENKHLPEVPSANEFKENGYKVGEMDDMLLRKIEELTLYVIQLKKENEGIKSQLYYLKNK